jgi:hypothetical protein
MGENGISDRNIQRITAVLQMRAVMNKFIGAIVSLLLVAPAWAQNVQYVSPVTRGHIPVWNTAGVIADGGSSADSPVTSIGVTNNGGAGLCVNSARATAPGYNSLCLGASTTGPAVISLQNYGTAGPQGLQFDINGTTITLPSGADLVTSTPPFFTGHLTSFASTAGTVIQDSGVVASGGVITQATWQGAPIGFSYGGLGSTGLSGAQTALGLQSMAYQAANAVAITGGTATGFPAPVNASDVAIKSYVDTATSIHFLASVTLSTATALAANTYNNGTLGVGATITENSNGALTIDGVAATLNARVLVKNENTLANNGIYTVTATGSGSAVFVLTRTADFNQASNMLSGATVTTTSGSTNVGSSFTLQASVATVGSSAVQFNLSGSTTGLGTMANQNANAVAITGGTITGMPTPVNPSDVATEASTNYHLLPISRASGAL